MKQNHKYSLRRKVNVVSWRISFTCAQKKQNSAPKFFAWHWPFFSSCFQHTFVVAHDKIRICTMKTQNSTQMIDTPKACFSIENWRGQQAMPAESNMSGQPRGGFDKIPKGANWCSIADQIVFGLFTVVDCVAIPNGSLILSDVWWFEGFRHCQKLL